MVGKTPEKELTQLAESLGLIPFGDPEPREGFMRRTLKSMYVQTQARRCLSRAGNLLEAHNTRHIELSLANNSILGISQGEDDSEHYIGLRLFPDTANKNESMSIWYVYDSNSLPLLAVPATRLMQTVEGETTTIDLAEELSSVSFSELKATFGAFRGALEEAEVAPLAPTSSP